MRLRLPKNDEKVSWTRHVKGKMRQYQLSERRLRRVLRHPTRKEIGVAPETIAVMQPTGTKKHPTEIWLMYQIVKSKTEFPFMGTKVKKRTRFSLPIKNQKSKIRIISAWRYPGKSPIGKPPPIPDDILEYLDDIIKKE